MPWTSSSKACKPDFFSNLSGHDQLIGEFMNFSTLTPEIKGKILQWIRSAALGMLGFGALLRLAAGTWNWPWGWIYLGLLTCAMAAHVIVLVPINPGLLADRAGGIHQPGAKRWDIWLVYLVGLASFAIMVVAGLDERWGWSGATPIWLHLIGILLFVTGWSFFLWAMASNPFFSESVRIHKDHQVASRGPYRFVRHPGYFGNLIGCLGQPLLFGSWWAFIPAFLTVTVFVVRTALEDRTLLSELDGYTAYARQVRYRLIPGIW
jgi:protein-S-isoprenylcysteine O-methyltransferase Ste14